MNELAPNPVEKPGQNGNPLLEGVQTDRIRAIDGLDDPNNTNLVAELKDEAHGVAKLHEDVVGLIEGEQPENRDQARREMGRSLLRNTLNAEQAQVFAEAGKDDFESAMAATRTREELLQQGGFSARRKANKAFNKAYDSEHDGMVNGANALAKAQKEAVLKERADFQEQLVAEEAKKAA